MSASRNNDRVGMLIGTDRVESFVPPRKGRRHVLRLVRDLLACEPTNRATDLAPAISYAQRVLAHHALVFVFSDFQLGPTWERFSKAVAGLRARHDVIACHLTDPSDFELPNVGMLRATDPETGEEAVLDTSSPSVREGYRALIGADEEKGRRLFTKLGIDEIRLRTDQASGRALTSFFQRRERRARG